MPAASTVVLVPCPDYDAGRLSDAVREGLRRFDIDALVRGAGGRPLLVKPNMLRPAPPEKGVTTHPSVFAAVARVMQEKGARVAFGDSPNGLFTPLQAARGCGIMEQAESLGIPLADFDSGDDVSFPAGAQNRVFHVARGVQEAGAIVSLPRLKTHVFTVMTGALKNTFGVIPGRRKAEFHVKCPDNETFSRMLVDLNGLVRPRLIVMDAIRAMEGNGPGAGDLVDVGLLIFSDDPVAADAVGCRLMDIDPLSVPMIRIAQERGLGTARLEDMRIAGPGLDGYARRGFKVPVRSPTELVPGSLFRLAKGLVAPKPVIDPRLCVKCGECVQACPTSPKSLSQPAGAAGRPEIPRYDYKTCIRCYCCQETCRQDAISVKQAPLSRFFAGRA